ncbi:Crp/Fnr family transcriptional regulator [Portibacter lacus]|uniref:Cyclic nucleotide-binding protein n=1 Tax=Portibacter lacus TaxID=1099794 RepID=A0AA37SSL3_9BACT|nr:Crp/Fnr family transcriptional regulator [Portibacter lacus]GLR18051.1 cyclic nucleotide-binding protein [Portibacter lacus]
MEHFLFDYLSKYIALNAEEKKAISDLDIFKQYKKGTILLKEGQYSDYGYFVVKGYLRCYYLKDGVEKTTAFYTEAESLNPPCIITKSPSEYYISVDEDAILISANSEMEQEIFQKFPKFEKLCRVLSEELLMKNTVEFDDFKTSTPEQRYLKLQQTRPDLLQRVPQYQIASFLGMTPQSLSRLRNRIVNK